MKREGRRDAVHRWLVASLGAVDPVAVTRDALVGMSGSVTVVAIGKAAPAMCQGAAEALGPVEGICVTNVERQAPAGIEVLVGDHPVPGPGSFRAGDRVLEVARAATGRLVALISGGGSALCEKPIEGVTTSFIQDTNQKLLDGGASIGETNLVRRHLSAIKGGGLARATSAATDTYIISDVAGGGPEVVASGPTIPVAPDPDTALDVMDRYGIPTPNSLRMAMNMALADPAIPGPVSVLADGHTAGRAVATLAAEDGVAARAAEGWFVGELNEALDAFFSVAESGVTIGAGEPNVKVRGAGVGGRNSHAALMAAQRIAGTGWIFAAFATDGRDGRSDGAGAIVDGTTIERGGDPSHALANSDSATYLDAIGDLLHTGPTGTNVSDLWLLWRP